MDTVSLWPEEDNPPQKCCTACGNLLPATTEFFHHHKTSKYGVNSICKACAIAKAKAHYQANQEYKKAYARQYHQDHREQDLAKQKAFREKNPEIIKARKQAYYSRPEAKDLKKKTDSEYRKRPEVRERQQAYHHRQYLAKRMQPEEVERQRAYNYEYYSKPENKARNNARGRAKWKEYWSRPEVKERARVRCLTRSARKKAVSGEHTSAQIAQQLKRQKRRCYYCSKAFEKIKGKYIYEIEHTFPLSRVTGTDIPANDIGYLVLACPDCNVSKGNKFPWEWPQGGRLL